MNRYKTCGLENWGHTSTVKVILWIVLSLSVVGLRGASGAGSQPGTVIILR